MKKNERVIFRSLAHTLSLELVSAYLCDPHISIVSIGLNLLSPNFRQNYFLRYDGRHAVDLKAFRYNP